MNVIIEKNVAVPMRDGTVLRADVYRPHADGRYPVLLQRTPYGKGLWLVTAPTLDPVRAAEAGYAVVIQDVRGRWTSEGDTFFPYASEYDDGGDTVAWAAAQPYSSGKVGPYGLSYMGGSAWLAAAAGNEFVGALSPTTASYDFWHNGFWRHGALAWGTLVVWALRIIGPGVLVRDKHSPARVPAILEQLVADVDAYDSIVRELPLVEFAPGRPDDPDFVPFLYDIMRHAEPDQWTAGMCIAGRHDEVRAPSLILAGWHDLLLQSDLDHFQAIRESGGSEVARTGSKLIIGPWSHGMFNNVVGQHDFGFRANGISLDLREDLTRLQLRWFDHWLKDEDTGIDDDPPVKIFVQGANRWRAEQAWPLERAEPTSWYLHGDGALAPVTADKAAPRSYVFDPDDPCPTCGGALLMPGQYTPGPVDQARIIARRDVLTYTSAVLEQDMEVTGPITAVLYAATSAPDTDWVVKLCDVHPDGRTFNVVDGILRASYRNGTPRSLVEPGAVVEYSIDLWATSMLFGAGHRLRVLVTSSDFPRYNRNPNSGELGHEATELVPCLQRVFHGAEHASRIVLPVVND